MLEQDPWQSRSCSEYPKTNRNIRFIAQYQKAANRQYRGSFGAQRYDVALECVFARMFVV